MDTSRVQPIKLARVGTGAGGAATPRRDTALTLHCVPTGHQSAGPDRLSGAVHSGERAGPGGRGASGRARPG